MEQVDLMHANEISGSVGKLIADYEAYPKNFQYFVLRSLWRHKRAKHFRSRFVRAFPPGSPREEEALGALHAAIVRDWASVRKPKAVVKAVISALNTYEDITGKGPRTLEKFEPRFPPPFPGTEAGQSKRSGFGRTASCKSGKIRYLFARSGRDLLVKITTPRGRVGPVVTSPAFKLGLAASAVFGMGGFSFKDQNGQRWALGVEGKEGNELFKWLVATENAAKAWEDEFVREAVAALIQVADEQPQPYLGSEFEAPSGQDKVVFAWTAEGLFVFRQSQEPHPLFDGQSAVFSKEAFSFAKGTGSGASDLGLKIGGIGGAAAMRVVDRSEQAYCFVGTKYAILPVLKAASGPKEVSRIK